MRPAYLRAIFGLTIAIVAVFAISRQFVGGNNLPLYRTEQVVRGPLVVHISATGALAPLIQVEVGTEISGTVESVLVDFNQPVERGQLLARINTERLEASTAQARASLALAEAQRAEAKARVFEAQSNLVRLRRVFELSGGEVPTQSELDVAQAAYDRAVANEAGTSAQISQAQATLDGFLSDLRRAR
ncbi:MAG: biotin/lipoyl-binding protein, partial [Gammaproteobacteria bacterium]